MAKKSKATNEDYIEVVRDENELADEMEDFMAEMGVEAGWNDEFDDGLGIPADYSQINLSDMFDEDVYSGKPHLTEIQSSTFTDNETGEEKTVYFANLVVRDDDEAEAYILRLNLKKNSDEQVHVHNASSLFALVMGIMECKQKGISSAYNELTKVKLSSLRNMLDTIEELEFEVVTKTGKFTYNAFRITDVKYE